MAFLTLGFEDRLHPYSGDRTPPCAAPDTVAARRDAADAWAAARLRQTRGLRWPDASERRAPARGEQEDPQGAPGVRRRC